jgi:CelD/BcsL family acetyltransferase involved in cellulose biosynthesis
MTGSLLLGDLELGVGDGEWGALAAETGNVFATPEWIATWWRHFGRGRRLLLTACRRPDGYLVGVLPLYLWRTRPLPVARFLGHGPGDALGPICRAADRDAVASALEQRLDEVGARLLVGDNLPGEESWSERLGARILGREASPVLTVGEPDWETLLASWSKNLRSQIRSRERKLFAEQSAVFRLADDPERFEQDLDRLFTLHRARWPNGSGFAEAEPFHREFASLALERRWARLWLLEIDGAPRAAWYGFRFANVESYYQAGRDSEWDRYRVGFVLLCHSIREAVTDGVREYRFLRGDEEFKSRFASHDYGLETIAVGRGRLGRFTVGAGLRLPRSFLRRLRRG